MARIHKCGQGWAYCDGNCATCATAYTTYTTTSTDDNSPLMIEHALPAVDAVPWEWLEKYAEGKRMNFASDFIAEAKTEWRLQTMRNDDGGADDAAD